MSEVEALVAAREAVAKLLVALGIDSVVCVDDVYARELSLEDLLVAQTALTETELREVFSKPDDVFPTDREVRRQSFREAWDALDAEGQRKAGALILALKARKLPDEPDDFVASSALSEIVGVSRLQTIRPSEWRSVKERIKAEHSSGRTLLLFDQDLGDGGGPAGGITLATDALTDPLMGNRVMCGLLTHTVTIANQHEKWIELAKPPLDPDRFVVVAKGWLSRDPLGFARMLKQVALTPDCRAMKKRAKQLLDEATSDAHADIDQIHVDDFESMVFRASKLEGLWEPDMLFRLYGIFHRLAVRKRAYTDQELRQLSSRLRVVSDVPTHSPTATPPSTWQVQRRESYEDGEYINALHLPVEVGDIFTKTDAQAEKYYMVLGQPCDLMVRTNGKRSPDSMDIVLAEVFTSAEPKENTILLPHFSEDMSRNFYVRLRPTHSVNPCVLDLCVFNADGTSQINLDADCPENVLPAWKQKYEYLKTFATLVLNRYDLFGEEKIKDAQTRAFVRAESPKRFPLFTSNSSLFKGLMSFDAGQKRLSFNCRRVKRLHRPRALAVALEYSQYLSRPAFDRDLAT